MIDIFKIANDAQKLEIRHNTRKRLLKTLEVEHIIFAILFIIFFCLILFLIDIYFYEILFLLSLILLISLCFSAFFYIFLHFWYKESLFDKIFVKRYNKILKEWSNQTLNNKRIIFEQLFLLQKIIDKKQESQINMLINELINNNIQLKNLNEIPLVHSFLSEENIYHKMVDNSMFDDQVMFDHFISFGKSFYVFNGHFEQMLYKIRDELHVERKKLINDKSNEFIDIV